MVVDGSLGFGGDHLAMSNVLNEYGITMAITDAIPIAYNFWNYCDELARSTGRNRFYIYVYKY